MGRRIPIEIDEYYHVYNRGVDKRVLFKDKLDYFRFISLLYICNGQKHVNIHSFLKKKEGPSFFEIFYEKRGISLVSIGAYCLMPNHFHILLREKTDGGVSTFMKKVLTAYAMYFNNRYKRKGVLFEGRYKAKHVDSDVYLKYLYAYIHLNPVKLINPLWKENKINNKKVANKFLKAYEFSSYQSYIGNKTLQKAILDMSEFPRYFDEMSDFKTMIKYWLNFNLDS